MTSRIVKLSTLLDQFLIVISHMYDLVPNAHISAAHRVVASDRIGVSYGQNSATTERHSGIRKTSVFISVLGYGSTICWTVQK
jgi:hypothetical protein